MTGRTGRIGALAVLVALVAGCGGGDNKGSQPLTTTVESTPTEVPSPTLSGSDPNPAGTSPTPTLPAEARNIHAQCQITLVTSASKDEMARVTKPFYCKTAKARAARQMPSSPFARPDECRVDVNVDTLIGEKNDPAISLGGVAGKFSTDCKRIRLVVYAYTDEDATGYDPDAPASKPPIKPGEKATADLSS